MSYPQPSANGYCVGGSQFFRLRTLLSSPGDIYESDQGCLALSLGPDSDLANINVNYFDDQVTGFVQQATIGPQRSFVGRVDANPSETYSPSKVPGRIFFWSADIYDPNFRPRTFDFTNDTINFQTPVLDVVQYFQAPPTLVPPRIDKQFVYQNYNAFGGTCWIVVPFYSRKFAYIQFTNRTPASGMFFQIIGVNFAISPNPNPILPLSGPPYHQEREILAPTLIPFPASSNTIVNATTTGMFDALVIGIRGAVGPAPLRIVTSDTL